MNLRATLALCLCLAASAAHLSAQMFADIVLIDGKVWTENPKQPEAQAVAILGNRIVRVGSTAEIRKLAGPATKVIRLGGKRVVPGFNDAHVHFVDGGAGLAGVQLRDANSQEEFRQRIAAFARTQPKQAWILNGWWDHERWTPAQLPTHQLIDDSTPNNPVFVERLDGHMGLANALAMQLAGITRETAEVAGGVIVRDAQGNPTGIFKDAATGLIRHSIPPLSGQELRAAVEAAESDAAENGVTSVQEMRVDISTDTAALRVYEQLFHVGKLRTRISSHQRLAAWKQLAEPGIQADFGNDTLHIGGLKAFADGSLGSTTAWFFKPYLDAPNSNGIPSDDLSKPEQMYADIAGADRAGLQIAIHAIGDRANNTILNFYERAAKENGPADRRFRIEHAQHLLRSDIPRFAALHVIASMQPYHAIDDGRWAAKRIDAERIQTTYAFRSLLDAGATLAFGSDWPVAPMVPLMGIYAAVTRRTLDGKNPGGWVPEQKITVAEAVHAYTVVSAFAEHKESVKGSLAPGKLADLDVLSEDIFHIDPVEIAKTRVEMTVFDGTVIYQRR
jgi:predicted amidohydrolase YtcJ